MDPRAPVLLDRVRAVCRLRRWPEGRAWTAADVAGLLRADHPHDADLLAVGRVDPRLPFVPDNARIFVRSAGG